MRQKWLFLCHFSNICVTTANESGFQPDVVHYFLSLHELAFKFGLKINQQSQGCSDLIRWHVMQCCTEMEKKKDDKNNRELKNT